ncbi:uncharacterized protein LOC110689242 [Chenopodium quinoa]|nr:uncharacterized protein LOC110689242 [Chenopodium quinoa]
MKQLKELQGEVGDSVAVSRVSKGKWKPPDGSFVKLNVDGGVVEGLGSSAGAVMRNFVGEALLAGAWCMEERWQPAVSEAMTLLVGLRVAVENGFRRIIVESDCIGLVNALQTRERSSSNVHLIYDDIYHVCNSLESVGWSFVHRVGNKVAHELAHYSPWTIGRKIWVSNFPCILSLLNSDSPMNES